MPTDVSLKRFAPALLRFTMAAVFVWFGTAQLLHSEMWVGFLPEFMLYTPIAPSTLVLVNGSAEIVLAVLLATGVYIRLSALILGLHLLGIAWNIGWNPTGMQDFGLALATLAISLRGDDFLSLDRFLKNKKLIRVSPVQPPK
ncbi:MAG: hypothetical protein UY96_C0008G0003 [Parcubacteria group bacterium GW2011_GWB1_56_8]|nr:MAG: hypothetical protein UY96_C0008G0003 [Parcubacteria group bacterium GW2011_GWB1_56_8]